MLTIMERKTTLSYVCILERFASLCTLNRITIQLVVTDYEAALRTAIVQVFPDGLTRGGSVERRRCIKMLMNIALLPNDFIMNAIEVVRGKYFVL